MRTSPLRPLRETPAGVALSADFFNDIINRVEDLVLQAQLQKPIAGNNVQINYTADGAVINAVTA